MYSIWQWLYIRFVKDIYWDILSPFSKLRRATVSFGVSVCLSASNSSASTGGIFVDWFFENFSKFVQKIQVSLKYYWTIGTLRKDLFSSMII